MLVTARAGQSLLCTAYDTKLLMMYQIVFVIMGFTCIAVQCFSALATSSSTPDTMEHNPSTCRTVRPEADAKCCSILFLQAFRQASEDLCNGDAECFAICGKLRSTHSSGNRRQQLESDLPAWPPSCMLQLLLFSAHLLDQGASSQVQLPARNCRLSGYAC